MTPEEYRELVHKETVDFDARGILEEINLWLDDYFKSSNTNKVVLGISGGKDSTVVGKILVDKLGKENVFGLLMPNGEQKDIADSYKVVKLLDIKYKKINIEKMYYAFLDVLGKADGLVSHEAKINIPPRIRMTTLYAFGQTHGCRVAGTGNLSEIILGYFTKFGDGAHDFNIIRNLTSFEVMRLGEELGLPTELVYKTPDDGLSGMSDEEKLGISYRDVHRYIRRTDVIEDSVREKIENMRIRSLHKILEEPAFPFVL